jgi:hypothetical protein
MSQERRSSRLPRAGRLALRDTPEAGIQTLLRGVVAVPEREHGVGPRDVIRLLLTIAFPAEHLRLPTESRYFRAAVNARGNHPVVTMPYDRNICLGEIEHELVAVRTERNKPHLVPTTALKDDCDEFHGRRLGTHAAPRFSNA